MKYIAPLILASLLGVFVAFAAPCAAYAQVEHSQPIVLVEKPADMELDAFKENARAAFGQAQKVDASVRFTQGFHNPACGVFTVGNEEISKLEYELIKREFEERIPDAKITYVTGDEAVALMEKMSSGAF